MYGFGLRPFFEGHLSPVGPILSPVEKLLSPVEELLSPVWCFFTENPTLEAKQKLSLLQNHEYFLLEHFYSGLLFIYSLLGKLPLIRGTFYRRANCQCRLPPTLCKK
jgi:hypothetical protein